jgi:hypothetical protein
VDRAAFGCTVMSSVITDPVATCPVNACCAVHVFA